MQTVIDKKEEIKTMGLSELSITAHMISSSELDSSIMKELYDCIDIRKKELSNEVSPMAECAEIDYD